MTDMFLWSVPFLLIPLSYVFYRVVPLRKIRYYSYLIILVAAFFLSLFHLTFHNDMVDTGEIFLINFILWEFFWFVGRVVKGKFFFVVLLLVLGLYGLENQRWIVAGSANASKLWKPVIATSYNHNNVWYFVKEKDCFNSKRPARLLTLTRKVKFPGLEKQIYTYRTPKGYYLEPFSYKWSDEPGVHLEIKHGDRTLWTMGEGF